MEHGTFSFAIKTHNVKALIDPREGRSQRIGFYAIHRLGFASSEKMMGWDSALYSFVIQAAK